jgi:hypothetical protein
MSTLPSDETVVSGQWSVVSAKRSAASCLHGGVSRTTDHWPLTTAFSIWAVLLISILVRAYLQPQRNTVYPIFANAARECSAGIDMYDRSVPRPELDSYRYAPVVAVFFSALAWLPDDLGGVLWRMVNAGLYLAGIVVFARTVFPGRSRQSDTAVAILAALLVPLSVGSLNNGQPNSLIMGCLLLALAAITGRHWWWAAACLAVPVLLKVYPVAVVLLLLMAHPIRLGWRTGLCILAGLLLPFALKDPGFVAQLYGSWLNQVTSDNRHVRAIHETYRDFHLLTRWLDWPVLGELYPLLQLAAAGLVAAVVLRGFRRGWSQVQHLRAALDLGCCWIILFGPATESCTYALLAPTLALATWEAIQLGQAAWKRWCMLAMVCLFAVATTVVIFPFGRHISLFLLPLGALLLFAERLMTYAWPRHPAGPTGTPDQLLLQPA